MAEITAETIRKHHDIKVRREHPFNAETPAKLLRESQITPTKAFYVRSHGDIPRVTPDSYRLTVSGLVERPLELSLEDVKSQFPRKELTATLYCAGNRRAELMEISPMPGKVPWDVGAVGNARWTGVLLKDVLQAAGCREVASHAAFTGLDRDEESGTGTRYGGSIPIEKALGDNVLLAYKMNGEPLVPEHGYPLRVVVGGYIGARSVKWLSDIVLQEYPSDNHYQAYEYKLFPPDITAETADFSRGEMLGEIPLNAVICSPLEGETLTAKPLTVRGFAIAGGDRCVERVEVSADGGRTWVEADVESGDQSATWRFWEASFNMEPGTHQLVVRAIDSESGTQPSDVGEVWNFQGYANNSWHRVNVRFDR